MEPLKTCSSLFAYSSYLLIHQPKGISFGLIKYFWMAAQPNEIYRIVLNTVDKHQVRLDMAVSKSLMIAGQRMIFVFSR